MGQLDLDVTLLKVIVALYGYDEPESGYCIYLCNYIV